MKYTIPKKIYIKAYQLHPCATSGIADARINSLPFQSDKGKLIEYIDIKQAWHSPDEEPKDKRNVLLECLCENKVPGNVWYKLIYFKDDWYDTDNVVRWAYIEDLLPQKQSIENQT